MPADHRKESGSNLTIAAMVAIPLLLFAAYLGSYYALLVGGVRSQDADGVLIIVPEYRWKAVVIEQFLLPAHAIDRRLIRPAYWNAVNWVV